MGAWPKISPRVPRSSGKSGFKNASILAVRGITSRIPRFKGLGKLLQYIARHYRALDLPASVFKVHGFYMRLDPKDLLSNSLIFLPQYWDYREREFVEELVSPGDLVVDVGANIGQYTLFFSGLVGPHGNIVSIEAERLNYRLLVENLKLNGVYNVASHNVGVSDQSETARLLLNSTGNNGGHSFFQQDDIAGVPPHQNVRCLPLADLIDPLARPKLIKLDIEGYEYRVLRNFFEVRKRDFWPDYIMLEDNQYRREGDALALCVSVGYEPLVRYGANQFLKLSRCKEKTEEANLSLR